MWSPYEPPPGGRPESLPPNLHQTSSSSAALWFVVLSLFAVAYGAFQPPAADPSRTPTPLLPFVIPPAVVAVCAFAFWRLRARLPASLRTGELHETARVPPPADASTPPPFGTLELHGRDEAGAVRITIADAGLHVLREAGLGRPAQELEIGWSELRSLNAAGFDDDTIVWGALLAVGDPGSRLRPHPLHEQGRCPAPHSGPARPTARGRRRRTFTAPSLPSGGSCRTRRACDRRRPRG